MKIQVFLLITSALVATPFSVYAQTTTNPAPVKPTKIEVVNEGELRLDGKLTGLLGAGEWSMSAYSFTSPRGVTQEFDEAKNKAVKILPTTFLHPVGEETKIALKDVKVGAAIAVIGKSGPNNSLIAREVLLLEGYGQRKTVGSLRSNPFTGQLIDQSRKARDAGLTNKALELAQKGAQGAAGMNDKSGEILATRDVALIYLEIGQFQQGLDASLRVEKLGRELGSDLAIALGLSGKGDAYTGLEKEADALKAYEEAATYGIRVSSSLGESIYNRLTMAYLGANQFDNTVQALEKLATLETANGKPIDAAGSRFLIGALRADDDAAGSRIEMENGEKVLPNATEPKERAGLLLMNALLQWRLGQKGVAKTRIEESKKLFEGQGDTKSAARMAQIITYLETASNADSTIANVVFGRFEAPKTEAPKAE